MGSFFNFQDDRVIKMFGVNEKVIVVTGGSNGLGNEICRVFQLNNAHVINLDKEAPKPSEVIDYIECDVSSIHSIANAFAQIKEKYKKIDFLINNAAIQAKSKIHETSEDEFDNVFNVNIKGAFFCCKFAIPLMLLNDGNNESAIINISSIQGIMSQKSVASYTCSKAALNGLTKAISVEYSPKIRAATICPGTINTDGFKNVYEHLPRDIAEKLISELKESYLSKDIANTTDVANWVVFLCSQNSKFFNGQEIRLDGGLGLMIPGGPHNE